MSPQQYELYNRQYELVVSDAQEALYIRNLDIKAKYKKTSDPSPNECAITILNLQPKNKEFLARKNLNVVLRAGFGDNIGQVFKGASEFTPSQKEPTDWLTTLQARDGVINYSGVNVSKSFKAGTPVDKMIRAFIKSLKLPPEMQNGLDKINELAEGTIKLDLLKLKYARQQAQAAQGRKKGGKKGDKKNLTFEQFQAKELARERESAARAEQVKTLKAHVARSAAEDELDTFCRSYGLTWTITDQTIHVFPQGQPVTSDVILLNRRTGLLGSPEPLEDGRMKIRSFLRHEYDPNVLVYLESLAYEGPYLIKTVEGELDTTGTAENWICDLECVPYEPA